MLISIISPKGGTGCSTTSALFGISSAKDAQTLLIDGCNGDLHGIINPDSASKYSFLQWCISSAPDTLSLEKIAHSIDKHLFFVSSEYDEKMEVDNAALNVLKSTSTITYEKRHSIVEAISRYNGNCVVDLGQRNDLLAQAILDASDVIVMTLKQCFLSLTAATRHPFIDKVDVITVLKESGRSISSQQIMKTLSKEVLIEIQARRDWAKTIDAGVLTRRTPASMIAPIDLFMQDQSEIHRDRYDPNEKRIEFEDKDNIDFWSRGVEHNTNSFSSARKFFEQVRLQ